MSKVRHHLTNLAVGISMAVVALGSSIMVILALMLLGWMIDRLGLEEALGPRALSVGQAHQRLAAFDYVTLRGDGRCTSDCAGHQAGFEWARQHGISDTWECPLGTSTSFLEGCWAYGEEVVRLTG